MGRETPATAHQTPPFPTAVMMDLEDSCPLPVRIFEVLLVSFLFLTWKDEGFA